MSPGGRMSFWAGCLAWAVAAVAAAAPAGPEILHLCDVGDWRIARTGRSAVAQAVGADAQALLVCTGGGLSAGGAPSGERFAFALAMLDAASFDVVNLAHRDLTGNPADLADALQGAQVRAVSASFRLADGEAAPWQPFAVVERGARRVAFIGLASASPAMALPDSGAMNVQHVPAAEALASALAQLPAVDAVVVLADAPLTEAADWSGLDPAVDAVLVSARGGLWPQLAEPTRLGLSPAGGTSVGRLRLGEAPGPATLVPLTEPDQPAPAARDVLARFDFLPAPASLAPPAQPASPLPLEPGSLQPGQTYVLDEPCRNRAATVTLRSMTLTDTLGRRKAPAERLWLVLETEWRNILTPQAVRDQLLPVAYSVPTLTDHLYLLADGRRLVPLTPPADAVGLLPLDGLLLPRPGSTLRGRLVYELPADALPEQLEVRFYDFAHGHWSARLVGPPQPPAPAEPAVPLARNEIIELGIYGMDRATAWAGQSAPPGLTFLRLDLRARSLYTTDADATAFDPAAQPGQTLALGTVADWKDSRRYLQLVADGLYASGPEPASALPPQPRFLPDRMTGGELVFLVPQQARSLQLRCEFPNAALPGGKVVHPQPVLFDLAGAPEPPGPPSKALLSIKDDVFRVELTGLAVQARFHDQPAGKGFQWLVLDVSVANTGRGGEFFRPHEQMLYADADGGEVPIHRHAGLGPRRPMELLWIPPGQRRAFQALYRIGAAERQGRLIYNGVSLADVFDLGPLPPPANPVP